MAETPFSPDSGAASSGTAPEDGNQGSPAQPPAAVSSEPAGVVPAAAAVESGPAAAEPAPLPEEPAAVADAEPPASASDGDAVASAPVPPAPEVSAAPEPAPQPAGVAATITVPPLEEGESGDGGEWELLVERISTWWNSGELNRQWQRIRGPLKGVAILVAVLLALQVYATVVRTIDAIPLVSGLLELTGLIVVLQFSATRLLRSSDRQEVVSQLQRRWQEFRGRS